jgi:hypothetical protein
LGHSCFAEGDGALGTLRSGTRKKAYLSVSMLERMISVAKKTDLLRVKVGLSIPMRQFLMLERVVRATMTLDIKTTVKTSGDT